MKTQIAAALLAMTAPTVTGKTTPPAPQPRPSPVPVFSPNVPGVDAYIAKVSPGVRNTDRRHLARNFVKAGRRYGVNPLLLAAIVRHESGGYKRNLKVCHAYGCDSGLGQINDVHIEDLKLDPERLVTDDAYNLEVAAMLLARAQKRYGEDPRWWSNYHDARGPQRRKWEAKVQPYVDIAFQMEVPCPDAVTSLQ